MSMPIHRVRPQMAEHTDGWTIGAGDRWNMEYEEPGRTARDSVEFSGEGTVVYPDTLRWTCADGSETVLTEDERSAIWPRFVQGMEALQMRLMIADSGTD